MTRRILVSLLLLSAAPAFGITTDEVKQLSAAGVGADVIVSQIRADGSAFTLTPAEILDLKKAGVPDAVLKAMIDTKAAPEKREPEAKAPEGPAAMLLVNDAGEPLSALISEPARTVFLCRGRFEDRVALAPGDERRLELPAGTYRVRWIGEKAALSAPLSAGVLTRVVATRVSDEGYEALHVSVLAGEKETDAGVLKVFHDAPRPAQAAQVVVPAPYYAYPPPPQACASPEPRRRRDSWARQVPWTLVGAGAGAVIGHQSGERDKGALVGAAAGLVLDSILHP